MTFVEIFPGNMRALVGLNIHVFPRSQCKYQQVRTTYLIYISVKYSITHIEHNKIRNCACLHYNAACL